jgi:hypothetical protein
MPSSPPSSTAQNPSLWTRLSAPTGLFARLQKAEPWFYAVLAGLWTLYLAVLFFGSMHWQLRHAIAWANPGVFNPEHRLPWRAIWSAPLDDVFIHFDFARSAARGHPFEWVDGNGYSSGGTSLLYPLVLALGMVIGFSDLSVMHFAGILACFSILALLLGLRRAFSGLTPLSSYVLPFAMLSVGALDWSLYSGMEGALFLAVWTGAFVAWDSVVRAVERGAPSLRWPLTALGVSSFCLLATRPEAVLAIAVLSLDIGVRLTRRSGWKMGLIGVLVGALPGAAVVVAQGIANRILTGDFSAAGSIVKLEIQNPHLTHAQVLDAYWSNLQYQVLRVTQYHFANNPWTGWIAWGLAVIPLVPRATRRYAVVFWLTLIGWIMTVAFNGQVRWQNERYTMPAVAWLLAGSSLGLGWLIHRAWSLLRVHPIRAVSYALLAVMSSAGFLWGSYPRLREQRWFFGRASRNIFEQHIQTGNLLRQLKKPRDTRVLVGDAGAIPYVSDLPALDIIGLGGTFELPFARASQWGLGASIELIQRLPSHQRPNLMAIYPTWWERLPLWFTSGVVERVPVRGNVICGGHTKVIYAADFRSLDDAEHPFTKRDDERVVDALDFADLVNEKDHGYSLSQHPGGFIEMKKLSHPTEPERDLWDAGRIGTPGLVQDFVLAGFSAGKPVRFLLRTAPAGLAKLRIRVDGADAGTLELHASDNWQEVPLTVPANRVHSLLRVAIETLEGGPVLYYLWAVQAR